MIIKHASKAGSLESNDLMVLLTPMEPGSGIDIEINSIVKNQYGDRIKTIVSEFVKNMALEDTHVLIQDRGALDCTIMARLETAIQRALEKEEDS